MLSVMRTLLFGTIGLLIFFVLLFIAVATKNDTLFIIAFIWLFAIWPLAELINYFF